VQQIVLRFRPFVLASVTLVAICRSAFAADPAASFVVKLFIDACVPNIGQPANVRAWAEKHSLPTITNPAALRIFVGEGNKGTAWGLPADSGSFALSIRGTTEACAVWARTADPSEVQESFKKIIEGVKRPGVEVKVEGDTHSPTPVGDVHTLLYSVAGPSGPNGLLFTMQTADRPGGPFQASLQVAVAKRP
jgi:hypothetical protein